jgi:hypothetical protein
MREESYGKADCSLYALSIYVGSNEGMAFKNLRLLDLMFIVSAY